MSHEPLKLSEVEVTKRCPRCHNPITLRDAIPDGTLWLLTEACEVCGWSTAVEDVKIGA